MSVLQVPPSLHENLWESLQNMEVKGGIRSSKRSFQNWKCTDCSGPQCYVDIRLSVDDFVYVCVYIHTHTPGRGEIDFLELYNWLKFED
jgi:hypothetical protein